MENVFQDYGRFENDSNNRIICFNVTRTYSQGERPDLYECVRKYWRLNGERAKKAEYVFAISSGNIVGVFKPIRWFLTDSVEYIGRWEFEGEMLDSPYLHMDISHIVGRRQNPVSYINM